MAPATKATLLPSTWDVPEEFRQRLGDDPGRQRTMQAHGHLLVILHAPPLVDSAARDGRLFWRDRSGRWTPSGASPAQPGVGDLLSQYERALVSLQADEDKAISARDYFDLLNRLNPIVRAARHLHEALQEAREAESKDRQLILWRDRAYAISRTAELLHNDGKNALDFAVAQRAEEEAEMTRRVETAAHRLNVLVACFFPIATLAAIFGMEMNNGLREYDAQHGPLPMLFILGVGLVLGLVLALFINRKS